MENDIEYDIINDIDLFDFIYKFDSKEENLDKYSISFCKSSQNDLDSYVSYFDMDGYFENIKKSYEYREDKMYNQFKIDYNRQNIKLNKYYYNEASFIKNLDTLLSDSSPKIFGMSWRSFVILACCQSSFGLPYSILQKKYIGKSTDKILVSGGMNSIDINITINNNKVLIELNNICYIKDTETGAKTHKINSSVTIELDKKIGNNSYDPLICVFSWRIVNV
jgi:hypothetical protein